MEKPRANIILNVERQKAFPLISDTRQGFFYHCYCYSVLFLRFQPELETKTKWKASGENLLNAGLGKFLKCDIKVLTHKRTTWKSWFHKKKKFKNLVFKRNCSGNVLTRYKLEKYFQIMYLMKNFYPEYMKGFPKVNNNNKYPI